MFPATSSSDLPPYSTPTPSTSGWRTGPQVPCPRTRRKGPSPGWPPSRGRAAVGGADPAPGRDRSAPEMGHNPRPFLCERTCGTKGLKRTCVSFTVHSCPSHGPVKAPTVTETLSPQTGDLERPPQGPGWAPRPMLTLGGQVEADVPVIVHGAVELAVTGLAEVERSPVVQLLATCVVAYLCREGQEVRWAGPPPAPGPSQGAAPHFQPSFPHGGHMLSNPLNECFASAALSFQRAAGKSKALPSNAVPRGSKWPQGRCHQGLFLEYGQEGHPNEARGCLSVWPTHCFNQNGPPTGHSEPLPLVL